MLQRPRACDACLRGAEDVSVVHCDARQIPKDSPCSAEPATSRLFPHPGQAKRASTNPHKPQSLSLTRPQNSIVSS
jgi:hypothetical protein